VLPVSLNLASVSFMTSVAAVKQFVFSPSENGINEKGCESEVGLRFR